MRLVLSILRGFRSQPPSSEDRPVLQTGLFFSERTPVRGSNLIHFPAAADNGAIFEGCTFARAQSVCATSVRSNADTERVGGGPNAP